MEHYDVEGVPLCEGHWQELVQQEAVAEDE